MLFAFHRHARTQAAGRRPISVRSQAAFLVVLVAAIGAWPEVRAADEQLLAGVAKIDVTNREAGPVNDPLFVKALVLKKGPTLATLITVDAVAIGEIGPIGNDYLEKVRTRLTNELNIQPNQMLVNASHCHGIVSADVDDRTVQAVHEAMKSLVPVTVAVGVGREDRIMENRRLRMKDGSEIDVRHAYSLPPDAEVAGVGPVDPEIGILRLDRMDGRSLAVVYNFACHPIQGVPGGANTADMTGFASKVIEDNLDPGTIALFVQGCAGDINPKFYKDVHHPRHAEPLGNMLGLSTLRALKGLQSQSDNRLKVMHQILELPRRDVAERIAQLEQEQSTLLKSLRGTSLNLKTFLPLIVKYKLDTDFPSYYSHSYIHERQIGRDDLNQLDAENRRNLQAYIDNIHAMERMSRNQTNLALLRKHQTDLVDGGKRTIEVEVVGLRVGPFVLLTFPGELTVQIGLNLKQESPHDTTFIAGYTNGYIYYSPTAEQLKNVGRAQEDSDCILAPEWQAMFESKALQMLSEL